MSINLETLRLLEGITRRLDNIDTVFNKTILRISTLERNLNKVPPVGTQKLIQHAHAYSNVDHVHPAGDVSDLIEDDAYGAGWNGDTTHAATQNALYDKINVIDKFGTITNTPDIDQDLLTTSSPTFASPVISTALLPDGSGGADIGSTTLELGDIYIADSKKVYFGSDQDFSLWYNAAASNITFTGDGTDNFLINNILGFYVDIKDTFNIRDQDDSDAVLLQLNSSLRPATFALGNTNDNVDVTHYGNFLMTGVTTDDERLKVPYLTGVPASVDNGSVWMEADGLHIYWNGAEKLVAGV
ncbi:hypothetical protein LCGC14_0547720 [marine sediment metagenome]|uniref:Uncharacterized protein n=1 Tax=marine sediment metagenome TaxID=412755 RepID=A0A0F9RQY0_9ZZZZ